MTHRANHRNEEPTDMKVWIDQDLCTGDGLCEEIAPDVFTLLDDGLAYVNEGGKIFADGQGQPAGCRGSRRDPRRPARRRHRVRRGVPRRVHLHRALTSTARRLGVVASEEPGAERRQERRVRHHAVIGSHGLALDVPAAVQHLDRAGVDPLALQRLADLHRLGDRRRVGDEDARRVAGRLRPSGPPATARAGRAPPGRTCRVRVDALVAVARCATS